MANIKSKIEELLFIYNSKFSGNRLNIIESYMYDTIEVSLEARTEVDNNELEIVSSLIKEVTKDSYRNCTFKFKYKEYRFSYIFNDMEDLSIIYKKLKIEINKMNDSLSQQLIELECRNRFGTPMYFSGTSIQTYNPLTEHNIGVKKVNKKLLLLK